MISRRYATLNGCTALALLGALGAGPATQPTAARPFVIEPQAGVYLPAKAVEAARIIVPRTEGSVMPNARPRYVTPRSEWIPKMFNGEVFYIIPCKSDVSAAARATAAPATQPAPPAAPSN